MTSPRAQAISNAELVRQRLTGASRDWRSSGFEALLALLLIVTLGVLAWLLGVVLVNGGPTLLDRGLDFFSSNLASRAGACRA